MMILRNEELRYQDLHSKCRDFVRQLPFCKVKPLLSMWDFDSLFNYSLAIKQHLFNFSFKSFTQKKMPPKKFPNWRTRTKLTDTSDEEEVKNHSMSILHYTIFRIKIFCFRIFN